ncbi:protein CutA homolog isoform X1 [Dicentrarchus labrax]|uniref:protein CutA homolog isoform X1 n=1 Tax=Dicentrarchus labrax TaxID=13489 RepID=UPI0021F5BD23|nr:protein CutA homolog isoform X1 [Dicentrarchus labrax]
MTFVATYRMEWLFPRCHKEAVFYSVFRSVLLMLCLLLVLSVSMYPGLWSIGVQLHSALTGSYVPGHHSVLLINSPNEQAAKDIGRAIMERRLAASINILSRTSTMYYWKGEIQDASEILMLVKTKTSRIQQLIDCVSTLPMSSAGGLAHQNSAQKYVNGQLSLNHFQDSLKQNR